MAITFDDLTTWDSFPSWGFTGASEADLGFYVEPGYTEPNYQEEKGSYGSLTCIAAKVKEATVNITSAFSPVMTATISAGLGSDQFVVFTQTSVGSRTRATNVTLETIITLSLQSARTRDVDSAQSSSTTVTANSMAVVGLTSSVDATATQTADANRLRGIDSAVTSNFTLSCDAEEIIGGVVKEGEAALTSSTSLNADAIRFVGVDSTQTSAFTQTSTALRIKDFSISAGALFTPSFEVSVLINSFAVLDSVASLSATATITCDVASALTSSATQTTDGTRVRFADSSVSVTASQTASIDGTKTFDSALTSSTAQTADAIRLRSTAVALSSTATQTVSAEIVATANASLFANATQSANVNRLRGVDSALQSTASQTATSLRIKDFSISAGTLFTPSVDISITKNSVAVLDSVASLSANVNKFTGASASLASTAAVSATIGKIIQFAALQAGTFALTAQVNRPTRNTTYAIASTPRYTGVTIDSNTKKWGSGSLRAEAVSNTIEPTTNIVWDGSNFKTFSAGYTWTSSDGLTWTRATNNISQSISQVKYVNGYYIVDSDTNNASTNSTTFSTTAPGGMVTEFLGGFYYYGEGDGGRLYVKRSTSINGTYSNVYNVGLSNYWFQKFPTSTNTGSQIVFAFPRQSDGAGVVIYGSGTTWNINATVNSSNDYAFPIIRFGNGTYVATFTSGVIRKSTNLTSWSTVTAPNSSYIRNIEYKNSNWVCNDFHAIYSGSTIDNLALRYTFNQQDFIRGFDYASNKYIALYKQSALYSSNLTSWTLDEIENISNAPGYIEYLRGDNTDYSQFGTMDFWINNPGVYTRVLTKLSFNDGYFANLNSNQFEFYISNGVSLFGAVSAGWNHIRISSSGGTISLYINGTRVGTGSGTLASTTTSLRLFGQASTGTVYIDEFLITDEVLTAPSATSFTVPTGEFTNTANTDLLLHFNGNFEDESDLPKTQSASASLSTAFTQSSVAVKTTDAVSTQSTAFTQSTIGNAVVGVSSTQTSAFTLTANGEELAEQATANLNAEFATSVDASVTRQVDANIASQAAASATALRIQQGVIATDAVFSELVAAAKVGDFLIDMASVATQTVEANRTRDVASAISSNAAVTAQTDVSKEFGAQLNSQATQTATALRIQDSGALAFEAFGAELAVVYVIARFFINCEVTATLTATAKVTTGNLIDANSTTTLTAQTDVTKTFVSTQSSTTQLTAEGIKAVEAEAALSSAFTVTAQPTATLSFITTEPVVATQTAQGSITASGAADISSALQFGLTVIDVTRTVEAQLTSNSSVNIVNQRVRYMDAQIASEFSLANSLSQIKRTSVDLNATCTLLATISHIEGADLQAFANSTVSTQANVLRGASANITSQATATILPTKLVIASANLTSQTQVNANAGKRVVGNAAFTSAFAPVMAFNIIHIDPYLTWKIQPELRTYKIQREDREFSIREETRQFIIKG